MDRLRQQITGMALLASLVIIGAGCAESQNAPGGGNASADCSADEDCEAFEACVEGECVLVDDGDVGVPDADEPDLDEDEPEPEDTVEDEEIDEGPQIGDPCDEGDDCPSGFCIEVSEGGGQRICTDFCNPNVEETCPENYVCAAVANSGADRIFLCFPEADFVCDTCEADSDCGGLSDLCLELPDGNFCGRSCDVRACPEGFDCVTVDGPEGPSPQCTPASGFCSACFDPDEDGYGDGEECLGLDCEPDDPDINPDADELCNNIDDDCDDAIDEDFDFANDPENCGGCENRCAFDGADPLCVESECALGDCRENRFDIDGDPENGCEYFCEVTNEGQELCNDVDEDCDGQIDEGFDVLTDADNCGQCGRACELDSAIPACDQGACVIDACEDLHYDIDGDPQNGCEYLCLETNDGVEACDNIDNDCDGDTDEDFDTQTDVNNCGQCGNQCDDPQNATATCAEGQCAIGQCADERADCDGDFVNGCEADLRSPLTCLNCDNVCAFSNGIPGCNDSGCFLAGCMPGFFDIDGQPGNGCEYSCTPTNGGVEACDNLDNDCDGAIDEDFDFNGDVNNCGTCGNECDFENAGAVCQQGTCGLGICEADFDNCDGDDANGCEVELTEDTDNCGRCGNVCAPFQGEGECDEGTCAIDTCNAPFVDCDQLFENGCEANLTNNVNHCGACGNVCAFDNAAASCSNRACAMGDCLAGFVDLNNSTADGCEYACTFTNNNDVPDPNNQDANCDGIDGNLGNAIFVRNSNSNDLNDGLAPDRPVATLSRALQVAAGRPERTQILIATGGYSLSATVTLRSGVSIYGGYSADFRTRSDGRAVLTFSSNIGIDANSLSNPTTLERIDIIISNRSAASAPAIGMRVNNSGNRLTLREVDIDAGNGGAGNNGGAGTSGSRGGNGSNASGASGGNGGSVGGGRGATGRRQNSGPAGSAGSRNSCGFGGSGGSGSGNGGLGCFDGDPDVGGNGGNGCTGTTGSNGGVGNNIGSLNTSLVWTRSNGANGNNGGRGGGGGGGGAGGGEDCEQCVFGACVCSFCGTGRGGGGGGGGGAGGTGGGAGQGGGASIGVLIRASTLNVEDVTITSGNGGKGGNGGTGGTGGGGGSGGSGATNNDDKEGNGGDGGNGGNGGRGGCGGGGGGGPSIAIWGNGSAVVQRTGNNNTFTAGSGGARGTATCGNNGATGLSANTRSVTLR